MNTLHRLVTAGVLLAGALATQSFGQGTEPPKVKIPEPGVPQVMTLEGRFVREHRVGAVE